MATLTLGKGVSVNLLELPSAGAAPAITVRTETRYVLDYGGGFLDEYVGAGFTYGADGQPNGGTITGNTASFGGDVAYAMTGLSVSVSAAAAFQKAGDFASIQKLTLAGNDHLIGGDWEDGLRGQAGDDTLDGGGGDDLLYGDEGDDLINGGAGIDTAGYGAAFANFTLSYSAGSGLWTVADSRANGLGTDRLSGIERIKFSDRTLNTQLYSAQIHDAYANILRTDGYSDIAVLVGNGVKTVAQAMTEILERAEATTTLANLSYQFFTGRLPGLNGIDFLVSPTGPNSNHLGSAYYQGFSFENLYINFAVGLGAAGEGKAAFAAKYGALSLFEATREAYATIFGGTPTDAKVHALIDGRADYFASYGGDGANGLGTKAAMVGWLLAEAVKADVGLYAKSNDAFLIDLADGDATFMVDLVGRYGSADYHYAG